jgi:hypothetical protein
MSDYNGMRHAQTAPKETLLVKSKPHGKAVVHTTFEGQRHRALSPAETHSHDVEVWPPRLNQQSQNILYLSAEIN